MCKVEYELTDNEKIGLINAEKIYSGLGIKHRFRDWIINRINDFNLHDTYDYWKCYGKSTGGRRPVEYWITKEVALLLKQRETLKCTIGRQNRKEIIFFEALEKTLKQIKSFFTFREFTIYQYPVGKYSVDCYMYSVNLIIEYYEYYHDSKKQKMKDKKRITFLKKELNCTVIIVKQGEEEKGIGNIINYIIEYIQ